MATSRKKYTRARIRARGRRPKRRAGSQWFSAAMATIVVLGILGVTLARSGGGSIDVPPQPGNPTTGAPGDHWHEAFAANICGEWLISAVTFDTTADNPNVTAGIHTHGDGFIHVEPNTKSEGGDNATLGRYLAYGGWEASEDSLSLWTGPTFAPATKTWSNGDKCPSGSAFSGKQGVVKYSINCTQRTGNPSDHKLRDREVVAVAFLPKSESIGIPPNANAAPQDDGGDTTPLATEGCSSAGPGADTTTTTAAAALDPTTPSSIP